MCLVALHTGLNLSLLAFIHNELVQFLLVLGAHVLQALGGLGGDVEVVHVNEVGSVIGIVDLWLGCMTGAVSAQAWSK